MYLFIYIYTFEYRDRYIYICINVHMCAIAFGIVEGPRYAKPVRYMA